MLKVISLVLLVLIASGIGFSQQGNTLYQTLINGGTGQVFNTGYVRTIGQGNSTFVAEIFDDGSNLCVATKIRGNIIGSYDQSLEFALSPINSPQNVQFGAGSLGGLPQLYSVTQVYGVYPYIRAAVTSDANTHCKTTIYYSGSLQTIEFPLSGSGLYQGLRNVTGSFATAGGFLIPEYVPNFEPFYSEYKRIVIYGYQFINQGSSATSLITTGCATSTSTTIDNIFQTITIGGGQVVTIAPSAVALFNCNLTGQNDSYFTQAPITTNATNISYMIWYRYE
jgi:hypothetical protein